MSSTSNFLQAVVTNAQETNKPVEIEGLPGSGTVSALREVAESMGGHVHEFRTAMCEIEDFRGMNHGFAAAMGLPVNTDLINQYTGSLPSQDLAQQHPFVVLLLSDYDMASPGVQLAALEVAHTRRMGPNYVLPENVIVIIHKNTQQ